MHWGFTAFRAYSDRIRPLFVTAYRLIARVREYRSSLNFIEHRFERSPRIRHNNSAYLLGAPIKVELENFEFPPSEPIFSNTVKALGGVVKNSHWLKLPSRSYPGLEGVRGHKCVAVMLSLLSCMCTCISYRGRRRWVKTKMFYA